MSRKKRKEVKQAVNNIIGGDNSAADDNGKLGLYRLLDHWRILSVHGKIITIFVILLLSFGAFGAGLKYLEDSARQDAVNGKNLSEKDQSFLSRLNPFASAAMPIGSPTPLPLSKEYVYAGSRLLAVEDANAMASPPVDLAIWRPSSGVWWVMGGSGSQQATQQWGQSGDKPVPGDYDGDGKTDFAIFRPDNAANLGTWFILYSATGSWTQIQWGQATDSANLTPADFDGDGKTDIALWRPSNGGWYILKSSNNAALTFTFGSPGDKPAPADYDGDGKADTAVWRDSNTTFYSTNTSDSALQSVNMSQSSTELVPADYDGDGKADYALRSGTSWYIRNSSDRTIQRITPSWQQAGDIAVHNDYDGDGKVDIAVWRSSNGNWYIRKSASGGGLRQEQWGMSGDIPVPAFYKR